VLLRIKEACFEEQAATNKKLQMSSYRQAITMPGGGIRYMSKPDILAVSRLQRTDAPSTVTHQELAQDGATTGNGLPVDELTAMINNLKVKQKKPRTAVVGQGVKPKGRRVAYV